MFHENTGFDQHNNGPLREDARSMDPAVSGPAIAALRTLASTFGHSLAEKNDIATEICDVYSCFLIYRDDYEDEVAARRRSTVKSWGMVWLRSIF